MKAFGIIFVVLGHVNFANDGIKPWIYAFHMPLFFFVTGMLHLKSNSNVSVKVFLIKNIERLLIPYIIWGLIYAKYEWINVLKLFYGSRQLIGSAGSLSSLWFLTVMFVANCGFYFITRITNERLYWWGKLLFSTICFILAAVLPQINYGYPWGVNVAVCALGFMLLGNLIGPLARQLSHKLRENKVILVLMSVGTVTSFIGTLLYAVNIPANGNINMGNALYGLFPVFLSVSLCGIVFILLLCLIIDALLPDQSKVARVLMKMGQCTLCIMMTHKPIIELCEFLFRRSHVADAIILVITCFFTIMVCFVMSLGFDQYLPFLTGKYHLKRRKMFKIDGEKK